MFLQLITNFLIFLIFCYGIFLLMRKFFKKISDELARAVAVKVPAIVEERLPYKAKDYFFSRSEQEFYNILNSHLDAHRYTIFPKVRMGDFIETTNHGTERFGSWNRIKSRHVDFLIWDLVGRKIAFAIELDGNSHNGQKAQETDSFKDDVYETINLELIRVRVGSDFVTEITEILSARTQ
jgi:hypothetical protein